MSEKIEIKVFDLQWFRWDEDGNMVSDESEAAEGEQPKPSSDEKGDGDASSTASSTAISMTAEERQAGLKRIRKRLMG